MDEFILGYVLGYNKETLKGMGGEHTAAEIIQQPKLWRDALQKLIGEKQAIDLFVRTHKKEHTKVVFTGAGTSEFVGNTLVPYLKSVGQNNVESIASTDLVAAPKSYIHPDDEILLVSCARSGNSPESVAAAQIAEKVSRKCAHLVLTCADDSELAKCYRNRENAYVFIIDGANDKGFAMTGSFSCMALVGSLVFQLQRAEHWLRVLSPWLEANKALIKDTSEVMRQLSELKKKRLICLGSGINKGIAQEAHLKALELSSGKNTASFDSPLGFRHGPKSVLNDESIVFFFCSDVPYTRQYELDMLKELMETKGQHFVVAVGLAELPKGLCHREILVPALPPEIAAEAKILNSLSYIVIAQLYALANSLSLGVSPDNPSPDGSVHRVVQGVSIYDFGH